MRSMTLQRSPAASVFIVILLLVDYTHGVAATLRALTSDAGWSLVDHGPAFEVEDLLELQNHVSKCLLPFPADSFLNLRVRSLKSVFTLLEGSGARLGKLA